MTFPEELRYTKDHEWIKIEGETATVGITEFAQNELGDIVFIEVDAIGQELKADEVFGSVEAVKTVSDLCLPVDGTVTEFNESLNDAPETVNKDPYGNGWIIKMTVSNPDDINGLMDATAYKALAE